MHWANFLKIFSAFCLGKSDILLQQVKNLMKNGQIIQPLQSLDLAASISSRDRHSLSNLQ